MGNATERSARSPTSSCARTESRTDVVKKSRTVLNNEKMAKKRAMKLSGWLDPSSSFHDFVEIVRLDANKDGLEPPAAATKSRTELNNEKRRRKRTHKMMATESSSFQDAVKAGVGLDAENAGRLCSLWSLRREAASSAAEGSERKDEDHDEKKRRGRPHIEGLAYRAVARRNRLEGGTPRTEWYGVEEASMSWPSVTVEIASRHAREDGLGRTLTE